MKTLFEYRVDLIAAKDILPKEHLELRKLLPKTIASLVEMMRLGIIPRVGERMFVDIDEMDSIPEDLYRELKKTTGINFDDQLIIQEIEYSVAEKYVGFNIYIDQAPEAKEKTKRPTDIKKKLS